MTGKHKGRNPRVLEVASRSSDIQCHLLRLLVPFQEKAWSACQASCQPPLPKAFAVQTMQRLSGNAEGGAAHAMQSENWPNNWLRANHDSVLGGRGGGSNLSLASQTSNETLSIAGALYSLLRLGKA